MNLTPTPRLKQLRQWLAPYLINPQAPLQLVAGDASFRRYYRLEATHTPLKHSLIIMDAPPEKEDSHAFFRLINQWHALGIAVPALLAADPVAGFALLQDFGDQQLMRQVSQTSPQQADVWYRQALTQLVTLQQKTAQLTTALPDYDATLLHRELDLFDDWLLRDLLQMPVSEWPHDWSALRAHLLQQALKQPRVTVHRDYHARNLMCLPDGQLGILDFQDAVQGPITYDAVSLIRDCYLYWPPAWQQQWLDFFCQLLNRPDISPEQLKYWFDWMGVQRHLKAAGIFARLWLRDGKPQYLHDVPRILQHLQDALAAYPEWDAIRQWLAQQLQPRLLQCLQTLPRQSA